MTTGIPSNQNCNPGEITHQGASRLAIPGFPRYEVLRSGYVIGKTGIMAGSIDKKGYRQVTLRNGDTQKTFYVHLLVAQAFLGIKPTPLHEVNHKNGIKADCNANNLEWSTKSYNRWHAVNILGKTPVNSSGMNNPLCKTSPEIVAKVKRMRIGGFSFAQIAREIGYSSSFVNRIFNGRGNA